MYNIRTLWVHNERYATRGRLTRSCSVCSSCRPGIVKATKYRATMHSRAAFGFVDDEGVASDLVEHQSRFSLNGGRMET